MITDITVRLRHIAYFISYSTADYSAKQWISTGGGPFADHRVICYADAMLKAYIKGFEDGLESEDEVKEAE